MRSTSGRWIWNRSQTRRDPKTGRRRQFPKAESEWLISNDESPGIVPQELWDRVQDAARGSREESGRPERAARGFQTQTASRVAEYPAELLSGGMVCGVCGAGISKVSGKSGGYYGCFGAVRGKCENQLLVRRTLAERIILAAVRDALASAENIAYVLKRVQEEVAKASEESPEVIAPQGGGIRSRESADRELRRVRSPRKRQSRSGRRARRIRTQARRFEGRAGAAS